MGRLPHSADRSPHHAARTPSVPLLSAVPGWCHLYKARLPEEVQALLSACSSLHLSVVSEGRLYYFMCLLAICISSSVTGLFITFCVCLF